MNIGVETTTRAIRQRPRARRARWSRLRPRTRLVAALTYLASVDLFVCKHGVVVAVATVRYAKYSYFVYSYVYTISEINTPSTAVY